MSEKKYIQSIERASMILWYISDKGTAKLNEISEYTGLNKSTAFGILQTLEHVGQIARTNNGLEYTLGLGSLQLGLSYIYGSGIKDRIHEILVKVVETVDETAYFGMKIGCKYYYLDYVVSSQPLKVVPEEGKFIDYPDNTAIAKVFTNSEDVNRYATDFESVYVGINCLAIPYKIAGKVIGCLVITGPSNRLTKEKMENAYELYLEIIKNLGLEEHL
jgi:IclR family acetate operon transcriptional repressor